MPTDAEMLARLESLTRGCTLLRGDIAAIHRVIQRIAELEGALEPFAVFGRYIQTHSRRGLDDLLYNWGGSETSAVVRQSDLIRAATVLSPAAPTKEGEAQGGELPAPRESAKEKRG